MDFKYNKNVSQSNMKIIKVQMTGHAVIEEQYRCLSFFAYRENIIGTFSAEVVLAG